MSYIHNTVSKHRKDTTKTITISLWLQILRGESGVMYIVEQGVHGTLSTMQVENKIGNVISRCKKTDKMGKFPENSEVIVTGSLVITHLCSFRLNDFASNFLHFSRIFGARLSFCLPKIRRLLAGEGGGTVVEL
jgi:hypothetical protein